MPYQWEYPLFVAGCDGGFAAVEVESETEERRFALAVFSTEGRCARFLQTVELEGEVSRLGSDREFAALVVRLRPPFTAVVFDSMPEGEQVNADWQVDIPSLLSDHLPLARSPWDYPLFALHEPEGYASISGNSENGDSFVAAGFFTRRELAAKFLTNAAIDAEIVEVDGPGHLADLLAELPDSVTAAAFNPTADGRQRQAKHCLLIRDIRDKYLPE